MTWQLYGKCDKTLSFGETDEKRNMIIIQLVLENKYSTNRRVLEKKTIRQKTGLNNEYNGGRREQTGKALGV